jgi:hypothetical protein
MGARLSLAIAALATSVVASVAGCTQGLPQFPGTERDAGHECGEADGALGGCTGDEICLQGFCYPRCSAERPCGPLEICSASGVCVSGRRDGGPPGDAGPPDPCEVTTCPAEAPVCRRGICMACDSRDECPGAAMPLCDLGRGICAALSVAVCGPCNSDLDCVDLALPAMRCITRSGGAPTEQVCLQSCDETTPCPTGFVCDRDHAVCAPALNSSCTGMRAALGARPCAADADCAPVGATFRDGLFTGSCFDPAAGTALTCHHPCGLPAHCPAGTTCDVARGFCL